MTITRRPSTAERMEGRITRRIAIERILGITGTALLAACAPAAVPASPQPTAASTSSAAVNSTPAPAATVSVGAPGSAPTAGGVPAATGTAIKTGGTLRTGMVGDILTTDGIYWSPNNSATVGMCYDALITYDDNLQPQPRLAESWELSADGTQIKLNLRKGVHFHSGREFTSDDVQYNLLRARDPKNPFAATVAAGSAWWTGIDTSDKYTVVLTSDKPRPGVFDFLLYLRILDKATMEGPDAATKVNGTGPFKWKEWVSGDHITLERNADYWDAPRPYLDGAQISIMRDQQQMVSAVEAGASDVAFLAPIQDAFRLKDDPSYSVTNRHDVGQYFYLTANATVAPTDNKQVRQALNYAIDRKRFADTILKGFGGDPQDLPWSPVSPAWDAAKNNVYTFDLDKARSLLDASGVTDLQFDIAWATAGYASEYASLATILQSDFASIGIKTNLKPEDNAPFTAEGNGLTPTYNGVRLSASAFANLSEASSQFTLSRTYGSASNLAGFYDDHFKALVDSASTEPDASTRKVLYGQMNDFLLDASYSMAICPYPDMLIMRNNVRGLGYATALEWTLRTAWLA
ncbi:MAG: ABC transporter substrate-binding protein [Chloroflexi bacterium]|nr:ABC transporter substrate-binding protein [Chloroflexota bacterium]